MRRQLEFDKVSEPTGQSLFRRALAEKLDLHQSNSISELVTNAVDSAGLALCVVTLLIPVLSLTSYRTPVISADSKCNESRPITRRLETAKSGGLGEHQK